MWGTFHVLIRPDISCANDSNAVLLANSLPSSTLSAIQSWEKEIPDECHLDAGRWLQSGRF